MCTACVTARGVDANWNSYAVAVNVSRLTLTYIYILYIHTYIHKYKLGSIEFSGESGEKADPISGTSNRPSFSPSKNFAPVSGNRRRIYPDKPSEKTAAVPSQFMEIIFSPIAVSECRPGFLRETFPSLLNIFPLHWKKYDWINKRQFFDWSNVDQRWV